MCQRCAGLSRRAMFGGVAALLAAASPAPTGTISGDEALHRLLQGNARYRKNHMDVRDYAAGRAARVATHRPIASILSCSDARVAPELLFDQGPGDLFVVHPEALLHWGSSPPLSIGVPHRVVAALLSTGLLL